MTYPSDGHDAEDNAAGFAGGLAGNFQPRPGDLLEAGQWIGKYAKPCIWRLMIAVAAESATWTSGAACAES